MAKVGPLDGPEPALQGPRRPIWRGTAGTLRSHDPGGLLSRFFFSSVTHHESHLSNASWLKTGASSHGYRQNSENYWPSLGPHIGAEHQEANFCGAQVLAGLNLVGLINLISGSLFTSAPLRGRSPLSRTSGKFAESSRKWNSRPIQRGTCAKFELKTCAGIAASCSKKNYGNRTSLACAGPENVLLAFFVFFPI